MLVCAFLCPPQRPAWCFAPPLPRRRRCALPSSARVPYHRWYRCGRRGVAVGARRGPATNQILDGRPPSLRCNAAARPERGSAPAPTALPVKSNQPSFIIHPPPVGRATRARHKPAPRHRIRLRLWSLGGRCANRQFGSRRARRRGCGQGRNARLAKAHAPSRAAATPPSSPPQASVVANAMLSLTAVPTAARAPTRPFSRRPTRSLKFMCVAARSTPARHARRAASAPSDAAAACAQEKARPAEARLAPRLRQAQGACAGAPRRACPARGEHLR